MKTTVTATQAKQSFWAVLKEAIESPVAITKRNRPYAYIISAEEYKDLKQLEEYEDMILGHLATKAYTRGIASEDENFRMNKLIREAWKSPIQKKL